MDSDYDKEDRVDYLPESFCVSAEARGQVEDCIECGKVVLLAVSTALYDSLDSSKVRSVNGYKHSQVSVILMLHEPHPIFDRCLLINSCSIRCDNTLRIHTQQCINFRTH